MSISVKCGQCGKGYRVGDDKAGKRFRCRECGTAVSIPAAEIEDEWGETFAEPAEDEYGQPVRSPNSHGAPGSGKSPASRKSGSKKKRRKKASKGENRTVLFASIGGGAVLLAGLIVGGIFLLGGDDKDPAKPAGNGNVVAAANLLDYVNSDVFAAVIVNPARMTESPIFKALPSDALQGGEDQLPVKPEDVEQVALFFTMPETGSNQDPSKVVSGFVRLKKSISTDELLKGSPYAGKREQATYEGKSYERFTVDPTTMGPMAMRSTTGSKTSGLRTAGSKTAGPKAVSTVGIYRPDDRTLVFAEESNLKKMLSVTHAQSPLRVRLAKVDLKSDLVIVVSIEQERKKIGQFFQMAQFMMPALKSYAELPEMLKSVSLTMNLSSGSLVNLVIEGTDGVSSAKLEKMVRQLEDQAKQAYAGFREMAATTPGAPPDMQQRLAMGDRLIKGLSVSRDGGLVVLDLKNPGGLEKLVEKAVADYMKGYAESEVTGSTTAPRTTASRTTARRMNAHDNMKQIGLAFHNYHDVHGHFPPAGSPNLSWRVQLLPFLEEEQLYEKFKLDQPWNSSHNKKLVSQMPEIFKSAGMPDNGTTRIRVFSGPGTLFPPGKGMRLRDVQDGVSNTLMAVEVGPKKAVEWTKPGGIPFTNVGPKLTVATVPGEGFLVIMGDGRVRTIKKTIDTKSLTGLITPDGGIFSDFEKFEINAPPTRPRRRPSGSRSFGTKKGPRRSIRGPEGRPKPDFDKERQKR